MVGALSCMSKKAIDFLALSLIMATHSVRVVKRGYRASLHSPDTHTQKSDVNVFIKHHIFTCFFKFSCFTLKTP